MTHTYAILELTEKSFSEIQRKLKRAGHTDCFHEEGGRVVIDMQGIAVAHGGPRGRKPGADAKDPSAVVSGDH